MYSLCFCPSSCCGHSPQILCTPSACLLRLLGGDLLSPGDVCSSVYICLLFLFTLCVTLCLCVCVSLSLSLSFSLSLSLSLSLSVYLRLVLARSRGSLKKRKSPKKNQHTITQHLHRCRTPFTPLSSATHHHGSTITHHHTTITGDQNMHAQTHTHHLTHEHHHTPSHVHHTSFDTPHTRTHLIAELCRAMLVLPLLHPVGRMRDISFNPM